MTKHNIIDISLCTTFVVFIFSLIITGGCVGKSLYATLWLCGAAIFIIGGGYALWVVCHLFFPLERLERLLHDTKQCIKDVAISSVFLTFIFLLRVSKGCIWESFLMTILVIPAAVIAIAIGTALWMFLSRMRRKFYHAMIP